MIPQIKFHTVAIAGTFDRLHKGHRYFIGQAFKYGHKVIIGLTSDEMANNKIRNPKSEIRKFIQIQNFQTRKKELEDYLKQNGLWGRAEIVMIDDVYGPAIENNEIEALVVTPETLEGAKKVSKKREEIGLKPIKILQIPLILAEDKKRIASTRIRLGEIDRWGRVLSMQISNIKYQISNNLRTELKKPLGKLIKGNPQDLHQIGDKLKNSVNIINPVIIITVGDEVTKMCNGIGIPVNLAIFDYKVRREEKYHSLSDLGFKSSFARVPLTNALVMVKNPPGHITKKLTVAVRQAYKGIINDGNQRIIQVIGEEDLAGVPAILLAPLGSLVIYGQSAFSFDKLRIRRGEPESGVVVVEVTEEIKQKLIELIQRNI